MDLDQHDRRRKDRRQARSDRRRRTSSPRSVELGSVRKVAYRENSAREQSRQHNGDHIGNSHEVHNHYYQASADQVISETAAETVTGALRSMVLLLTGLDHYLSGLRLVEEDSGLETKFRRAKHLLLVEHGLLVRSVQSLLQDHVDGLELSKLLANWETTSQEDHGADTIMRHMLGSSYARYIGALNEIRLKAEEMQSALELDRDGKGPFELEERSVSAAVRDSKHCFDVKSYWPTMIAIRKCNEKCARLTGVNISLSPIRKSKIEVSDVEGYRHHASKLFELLLLRSGNNCSTTHIASLRMPPRTTYRGNNVRDAIDPCSMRVVFEHRSEPEANGRLAWTIEETDIVPVDQDLSRADHSRIQSTAVGYVRPMVPRKTKRGVASDGKSVRIHDICKSIRMWRKASFDRGQFRGYLSDAGMTVHHSLHVPQDPITDGNETRPLKLADILQKEGRHRLPLLDRRRLALAIARGVLYLYDTPWIDDIWSKKEIVIFQKTDAADSSRYACVSREIPSAQRVMRPDSGQDTSYGLIRNHVLFALGIILIELELEAPFEKLSADMDSTYGAGGVDASRCAAAGPRNFYAGVWLVLSCGAKVHIWALA